MLANQTGKATEHLPSFACFPLFKRGLCLFFVFLFCLEVSSGQPERYRVVFYNVENLYDTRRDTTIQDEAFTPRGTHYWGWERYNRKLKHLSEALLAVGEGIPPAFIGLAEVENRGVLQDLIGKTALAQGDYGIVHADSPDRRGIDVALLYRKACFRVLTESFLPVLLGKEGTTRDILYCKGILGATDTLHFFVCHFPSMVGGERQSEWRRIRAAGVVRRKVDSLQARQKESAIIIMGDLNGKANTEAQRALGTKSSDTRRKKIDGLYNTSYYLLGANRGSYRYQGVWETIDHIIVSGVLLDKKYPLQASRRMEIFDADFLKEEDKTHYGTRPFPTYRGPRYYGGYSDHLPVFMDLVVNRKP